MIYLDNAATTGLKPPAVIKAVSYAMNTLSGNPGRSGHDISTKAELEIFKCRTAVKELIKADSENNVCFTLNCTHAVNTVLYGVLKDGDHIIISDLEHNAVVRPINYLSKNDGVEYSVAKTDFSDDELILKNIESLIRKNTKMIFVTAGSNVLGRALPLNMIGELCKEHGLLFGVDGAQAVGVKEIDMVGMNIDFLCIAPHKGLYAPMGTGILVARKPINRVLITGGTGVNSIEAVQPSDMPERIESGTVNVPGICGIRAGVDYIRKIGIERIYDHEMKFCGYLYKALKNVGAILYTPYPTVNRYLPVVSFNIDGHNSEEVAAALNKYGIAVRAGLHCAPSAHKVINTLNIGTVRISPAVFNSLNDVDRVIFALKRIN